MVPVEVGLQEQDYFSGASNFIDFVDFAFKVYIIRCIAFLFDCKFTNELCPMLSQKKIG
jgi:hypothetical protein